MTRVKRQEGGDDRNSPARIGDDDCRFTVVTPIDGCSGAGKHQVPDLSSAKRVLEEHDPRGRGWVYDRETEERFVLGDLK